MDVALANLRHDPDSWPRTHYDAERVDLFLSLFKADDQVPPIEVVARGDGSYLVADGIHRTQAAAEASKSRVDAVVIVPQPGESPEACAYRRALETATRSALPLRAHERRRAARRLIQVRPDLSHRAIAQLVGVSHDSVDRWAKDLAEPAADDVPTVVVGPTAPEIATRMVRMLVRLDHARGILDHIAPRRMGKHLAQAFVDESGDHAFAEARRFADWINAAVAQLDEDL